MLSAPAMGTLWASLKISATQIYRQKS